MNRDPALQKLFNIASRASGDDAFVAEIMERIARERRRTITLWSLAAVAIAAVAWLFVPGVIHTVNLVTQFLPQPLVDIDSAGSFIGPVIAPLNSVSTLFALALLSAWLLYRKIF